MSYCVWVDKFMKENGMEKAGGLRRVQLCVHVVKRKETVRRPGELAVGNCFPTLVFVLRRKGT